MRMYIFLWSPITFSDKLYTLFLLVPWVYMMFDWNCTQQDWNILNISRITLSNNNYMFWIIIDELHFMLLMDCTWFIDSFDKYVQCSARWLRYEPISWEQGQCTFLLIVCFGPWAGLSTRLSFLFLFLPLLYWRAQELIIPNSNSKSNSMSTIPGVHAPILSMFFLPLKLNCVSHSARLQGAGTTC